MAKDKEFYPSFNPVATTRQYPEYNPTIQEAFHPMTKTNSEWLSEVAAKAGHTLQKPQTEQLLTFCSLLLLWNKTVNLTGAKDEATLIKDHLPDSFAMSSMVPENMPILDIGSGGGLPGIPFAILRPDCHVTLVEPRAKRTAFLAEATRKLNLKNVRILRSRLEEMQISSPTVCSSKATFEPQVWIDLCLRHCPTVESILVFLAQEYLPEMLIPTPEKILSYQNLEGDQRTLALVRPIKKTI